MQNTDLKITLDEGLYGINVKTSKFKTERTAICFALPITKENVACTALLSRLLCRSTADYPTPKALKERLNLLYGAELMATVTRCADNLLMKLSCISLCDKYALTDESISAQAVELLKSAVFNPNVQNGEFSIADFTIEKRLVIEEIRGLINDKRSYTVTKALEKMCDGEPFGIMRDEQTVESLTPKSLYDFWQNLLKVSPAYIIHVGKDDEQPIFDCFKEAFSAVSRDVKEITNDFSPVHPKEVREFSEQMEISQGKLVLGFRTFHSSLCENIAALRVMTDIFGGSPYSKLFTVVREKMSLCYYCAARLYAAKGLMLVDSGIEIENAAAARKGILEQLELIKEGNFPDEILEASKIGLTDAIRSVEDTSGSIEVWYASRLLEKELSTPADFINDIEAVTKQQIVDFAKDIELDTVYLLKGKEGKN